MGHATRENTLSEIMLDYLEYRKLSYTNTIFYYLRLQVKSKQSSKQHNNVLGIYPTDVINNNCSKLILFPDSKYTEVSLFQSFSF